MLNFFKDIFNNKDKLDEKALKNLGAFIGLVDVHLKREHPYIKFDCSACKDIDKTEDIKLIKSMIIEESIKQFVNFEYIKTTQKEVKKEILWSDYAVNSLPSQKRPIDFLRRKEIIFLRDKQICNRCGNKIEKLNQAYISFIKDVEFGGGYNVENLALICVDCNQVLSNKDKAYKDILLPLRDKLYALLG